MGTWGKWAVGKMRTKANRQLGQMGIWDKWALGHVGTRTNGHLGNGHFGANGHLRPMSIGVSGHWGQMLGTWGNGHQNK